MIEQTFVILKPDVVSRGLVGEIISRFEKIGLKIAGIKMVQASREVLEKHYYKDDEWKAKKGKQIIENKNYPEDYDPVLAGNEIIEGLIHDMMITPVIAMVLEGHNAVKVVKKLTGPTNIEEAMPGTIRGDYSHDTYPLANQSNRPIITIIHCTDDVKEAKKEIDFWFSDSEIFSYKKPEEDIHYRSLSEDKVKSK